MSPFEEVAGSFASRIRQLPVRRKCALFLAAAGALEVDWRQWAVAANVPLAERVFGAGLRVATAFVLDGVEVDAGTLVVVEASTPSKPTDTDGFTAAQNCWICLDSALRGARGEADPADSAWYLLESLFQSTSERLFGYSDVGSSAQEQEETRALADPALANGIQAVDVCIGDLVERALTRKLLDQLRLRLQAVRS